MIIDHDNNLSTLYAHLDQITVTKNQEVQLTTIIGTEGQTGWATGPHLHFDVRVFRVPVNPEAVLD